MREHTRRRICRSAFLALALAPTLATCIWAAYRVSPLHTTQQRLLWEQRLETHLGLHAAIQSVSSPRGDLVLLSHITLFDPDSQRQVLKARLVELARRESGWVIIVSQPEIAEGQFFRLWQILDERYLRGLLPPEAVQIAAGEVTVHDWPSSTTFSDVCCTLQPTEQGAAALLDFRVAGIDMPQTAQLRFERNRQLFPPRTRWHLNTGGTPLPCAMLADYCTSLAVLGPDSRFQGTMWAEASQEGWAGEVAGRFLHVDLQQVIEPFPHKLSGAAELVLNCVRFEAGRLTAADGYLRATGGVIGTKLIAAFAKGFGAKVVDRPAPNDGPYHVYTELAVGFQLDEAGIRLDGLCDAPSSGVLLLDRLGPLASLRRTDAVPAMTLATVLSPHDELNVPATREAHLVARMLPLPEPTGAKILAAERPQASVRLQRK
jgi:hypothetical protein